MQPKFPESTTFNLDAHPDLRCCNVHEPDAFALPKVVVERPVGLARGRKRKFPEALSEAIEEDLRDWREEELFELYYGEGSRETVTTLPSSMIMGDDVIERIATSGRRILTPTDLAKVVRWAVAFGKDGELTECGEELLKRLARVYDEYDESQRPRTPPREISPERFYANPASTSTSSSSRSRGHASTGRARGQGGRGGRRASTGRARGRGGPQPTLPEASQPLRRSSRLR